MDFIKLDENQKVSCFGECKIIINTLSKQLIIEPKNEKLEKFSANFDQKFIQQKHFLFVMKANIEAARDFILVFLDEHKCLKVFNNVQKSKEKNFDGMVVDSKNFLLPFLQSIQTTNNKLQSQIENIIDHLIQLQNVPEKDSCQEETTNPAPLLNQHKYETEIFETDSNNKDKSLNLKRKKVFNKHQKDQNCITQSGINSESDYKGDENETDSDISNPEKRKPKKCKMEKQINANEKYIIKLPNFEVKDFKKSGIPKNRLIIFTNCDKKYCYEYHWLNTNYYYVCSGCDTHKPRRTVTARIFKDSKNGKDYVKLSETEHACEPREYDPEKFKDDQIIFKSNYEKVEYSEYGITKKRIIILASNDRKTCYEFNAETKSDKYFCRKCLSKRNPIRVTICKNKNGEEEYLIVTGKEHVCEPIEYDPTKYATPKIVEKPHFQLIKRRTKGKILEKLFIFDEIDPSLCYEYTLHNGIFYCLVCRNTQKTYVSAKIINKNQENGAEYLELNKVEHVCKPKKFIPEDLNANIVNSDGFTTDEYRDQLGKIKQRLIVFGSNNRKLCHVYHNILNRGRDYWLCSGCQKLGKSISVRFDKDENDQPYVILSKVPHICELQEYIPSEIKPLKPPKIISKPNFIIDNFIGSGGKEKKRLIIFDENDRTLCYTYNYFSRNDLFYCGPCGGTTAYVTARLCQKENNGDEYIKLNDREHTCQPQKYINESCSIKIVKTPDFILREDPGNPEYQTLVIVNLQNRDLCYNYTYWRGEKKYVCKKCRLLKQHVTAKLLKDENGENYVELGRYEHLCPPEPIKKAEKPPKLPKKYQKKLYAKNGIRRQNNHACDSDSDNKLDEDASDDEEFSDTTKYKNQIIYDPYFKLVTYKGTDKVKSRLWIFPISNSMDNCYEYFWSNYYDLFLCCACESMKPKNYSTAMMVKKNDGKNCVEIGRKEHKCEIRKFNLEKFKKYQIRGVEKLEK